MEVRRPTDDDVEGIARCHAEAWRAAYRGVLPDQLLARFDPVPDESRLAEWREHVAPYRDRYLVAVEDGEVRGYAQFRWEDTKPFVGDDEAGLKELYVDPDHWGDGIGTALLEEGLELLPDDAEALRLEMLDGNEVGAAFYEARGFERTDEGTTDIGGGSYPTVVYALDLE